MHLLFRNEQNILNFHLLFHMRGHFNAYWKFCLATFAGFYHLVKCSNNNRESEFSSRPAMKICCYRVQQSSTLSLINVLSSHRLNLPVVFTTIFPVWGSYNPHTVSLPPLRPAPSTQTDGWLLAMVCGIVAMIAVQVDPSPPHSPHASFTFPLFGIPSHPAHVELVPLQTPERKNDDTTWC